MKSSQKNKKESIKGRWGVPLLNFERGPGVRLLNLREIPGPTFKLSVRFQVLDPTVPRSRDSSPTFTPCLSKSTKGQNTLH